MMYFIVPQMLYFAFNERPKELFDKICEIKVLNAKVLLLESMIGSFKFDLGMVYDEPGIIKHCITWRCQTYAI